MPQEKENENVTAFPPSFFHSSSSSLLFFLPRMVTPHRLTFWGPIFGVILLLLVVNELCYTWTIQGIANRLLRNDTSNSSSPGRHFGSHFGGHYHHHKIPSEQDGAREEPFSEVLEEVLERSWTHSIDVSFVDRCKKVAAKGARPHHEDGAMTGGGGEGMPEDFFEAHVCSGTNSPPSALNWNTALTLHSVLIGGAELGPEGPAAADVYVVVERKGSRRDFEASLPKSLSPDDGVDTLLRKYFAPDTFYVEAVGPEVLAVQRAAHFWHDAPSGILLSYVFRLTLATEGTYLLRVTHMFAGYQAILEEESGTGVSPQQSVVKDIKVLNRVLFEREHTVTSEGRTPETQSRPCDTVGGSWRYGEEGPGSDDGGRTLYWNASCLPECLLEKQPALANGSWTNQPAASSTTHPQRFVWWRPANEQCHVLEWPETSGALASQCSLKGKSLLFQGDSTMRTSFETMMRWGLDFPREVDITSSCRELRETATSSSSTQKFGDGELFIPLPQAMTCAYRDHRREVTLSYTLSRYGEASLLGYADYDAIVAGFGYWPAATKAKHDGHWTLERYWSGSQELAQTLGKARGQSRKPKVVWISITAFPERMTREVDERGRPKEDVMTDDWRNNVRLELMNALAAREMERAGVTVLDTFPITLPLKVSPDNNHYPTLQQHVILRYLLTHLCT